MTLLLRVTLAAAAGLLVGFRVLPPSSGVVAACALAALVTLARGNHRGAAAAFLFAGAAVAGLTRDRLARDCRFALVDGAEVSVRGVPAALPVEGVALPVQVSALAAGPIRCGGLIVRAHVNARHAEQLRQSALGDSPGVVLTGRWLPYPARNGWPRRAEYAGALLVDSVGAAGDLRANATARFRARRQQALREIVPQRWPLAEAVLLAQTSGLTRETRARWAAAGLVHLLAISGMHVGLIAGGVIGAAALAGLPRRRGRRLALAVTAAYVVFLGAPHAALRALLQAALLLSSLELQRPAEPFTVAAAAALIILGLDPLAILDPGFQLSFAGIVGLIAWRRPLLTLLPRRGPVHLREGLAAGAAASALTTPIAALHFGQAAWIGIAASILATPVLALAIALLLVALLVHAAFGRVPALLGNATDLPLRALDAIAEGAARLPGGHTFLAPHTVLALLAAVAVVIVVRRALAGRDTLPPPSHASAAAHLRFATRGRQRIVRVMIAAGAGVVVVAWAPLLLQGARHGVEIHAIDVGQGDGLAVRTPGGQWLLVDAGPRTPRSDAGRDRVVPYLQRRGVRRIEALILTHPDADHIGGAAAVLDAFDVRTVIDPGLPAGKDMFIDLLGIARSERSRWIAARAGMSFTLDGVRIDFLYPPHQLDALRDANDNSVVFRLVFGSFAALFLGDAPAAVEEELVARHGNGMRAAVLKVGHHGSVTSTSAALLQVTRPEVALLSAGRRNRYGHPAPSVVRRLEQHRVRVLRTDELGHIVVRARRDGRVEVLGRR